MPKTKAELKHDLTLAIAAKLCEIEDLCHAYALTSLTQFTCICRDPTNPHMTMVVTSESEEELALACQWAQTETLKEVPHGHV